MTKNKKKKPNWGEPGAVAVCRNQVGRDWAAALLLYRVKYRWEFMKRKVERWDKEWIVMSRSNWAREAGLSEAEMKNRALPRLKKNDFVEVRQMKLRPDGPKLLGIHLDLVKLAANTQPWDIYDWKMSGMKTIGHHKEPGYAYAKDLEES